MQVQISLKLVQRGARCPWRRRFQKKRFQDWNERMTGWWMTRVVIMTLGEVRWSRHGRRTSNSDDRWRSSITRSLEANQIIQVERLSGVKKIKLKRKILYSITFTYFKPVNRFKNRSGVSEFKSHNDETSKGVLYLLHETDVKVA